MSTELSFDQRAQMQGFNLFLSYSMEDDQKAAAAGYVFLGAGPTLAGGEVHIFQKCDLATIQDKGEVPTTKSLADRGLKLVAKPVTLYFDWLRDTWSATVLHSEEDVQGSRGYQDFAGTAVIQAIVPLMADTSGPDPMAFRGDPQRPAYLRFMDRARELGCTLDEDIHRKARELYVQYLAGPAGDGEAVKIVDDLIREQMKNAG